jgi:cellulose synthase (UDP-forming)
VQVAARSGFRLGCVWGPLDDGQHQQLQELLYQRSGQWPSRRAPAEPLALAATAVRLLRPMPAEDWFQRSLLPVLGRAQPSPADLIKVGPSPPSGDRPCS